MDKYQKAILEEYGRNGGVTQEFMQKLSWQKKIDMAEYSNRPAEMEQTRREQYIKDILGAAVQAREEAINRGNPEIAEKISPYVENLTKYLQTMSEIKPGATTGTYSYSSDNIKSVVDNMTTGLTGLLKDVSQLKAGDITGPITTSLDNNTKMIIDALLKSSRKCQILR
jgi:hypothetical protein